MKPRFADALWQVLMTFPIPTFIFLDQKLALCPSELAVYLYFCFLARVPKSNCKVRTGVDQLAKVTGYTSRQVNRALNGLLAKRFLKKPAEGRTQTKGAQSTDTEFEMCNPRRGGTSLAKPILSAWESSQIRDRQGDKGLRSLLYLGAESYLTAPVHLMTQLKLLRGTPIAVYVAVLQLASERRQREFDLEVREWRELAGIARNETFDKATEKLADNKIVDSLRVTKRTHVTLKNPATGRDLEDEIFEAEIKADGDREMSKDRPYTRDQLLKWAASVFTRGAKPASNDEMLVFCDCGGELQNRRAKYRPTLSMNGDKGKFGVYYCHSCGDTGTLLRLVMKYGHLDVLSAILRLEALEP